MSSIPSYISALKKQISLLLSKYQELTVSHDVLHHEKSNLLERVKSLENEIQELKKHVEVAHVVKGISVKEGESAGFARLKVNNLIREIDKCISLLNE
tara:strand:+ start:553 stop:846 length:294 start_codon:yes stop_codon:yes gene_type:complete